MVDGQVNQDNVYKLCLDYSNNKWRKDNYIIEGQTNIFNGTSLFVIKNDGTCDQIDMPEYNPRANAPLNYVTVNTNSTQSDAQVIDNFEADVWNYTTQSDKTDPPTEHSYFIR